MTNEEKIRKLEKQLEKALRRYDEVLQVRGKVALEGDLRENAGFQGADEALRVLNIQIANLREDIAELKKETSS